MSNEDSITSQELCRVSTVRSKSKLRIWIVVRLGFEVCSLDRKKDKNSRRNCRQVWANGGVTMVPSRIVISRFEMTCSKTKLRISPGRVRRLGATILVAGCTLDGGEPARYLPKKLKGKIGNHRDIHIYIITSESESDKKLHKQSKRRAVMMTYLGLISS